MVNKSVSVCVYTEYSNNDIVDVYNFDADHVARHIEEVGAYMLMRSIKSNGFDRGKVGIVNLSFYNKDGSKHYLYQMVQYDKNYVEFIKPIGDNVYYEIDSDIWKSLVTRGFKFCMNNGIIF